MKIMKACGAVGVPKSQVLSLGTSSNYCIDESVAFEMRFCSKAEPAKLCKHVPETHPERLPPRIGQVNISWYMVSRNHKTTKETRRETIYIGTADIWERKACNLVAGRLCGATHEANTNLKCGRQTDDLSQCGIMPHFFRKPSFECGQGIR